MAETIAAGEQSGPQPPHGAAPAATPASDKGANAGPSTVLIIEDDAIIAMAVAEELRANDLEVVAIADNGPAAIALAARHRPALVIADVRLRGDMNGIVAARRIKEQHPVRVVFASAHIDMTTRGAMEAVGYDAILPKPYTPEQLVRVVRTALGD